MKKLIINKIDKKILKQCKEIASTRKYLTSTIRVYEEIRNEFCIANDIEYIVKLGFPLDLVIAIEKEVFN